MAECEEEHMDDFAAQCLELYECGSSIDSSDANDIVIWSLTGPPTADFHLITDQDSHDYKVRLQRQVNLADDYVESTRTPMSELLKINLDIESMHIKQTNKNTLETIEIKQEPAVELSKEKEAITKGGLAGKFINWLRRKVTVRSKFLMKNFELL